jgi:hypothetical protein
MVVATRFELGGILLQSWSTLYHSQAGAWCLLLLTVAKQSQTWRMGAVAAGQCHFCAGLRCSCVLHLVSLVLLTLLGLERIVPKSCRLLKPANVTLCTIAISMVLVWLLCYQLAQLVRYFLCRRLSGVSWAFFASADSWTCEARLAFLLTLF